MRIIYHCYGSAHSSITAAAIHLGRLPCNYTPSVPDIIAISDFDVAQNDSLGHLFFKGKDELGYEVYTMGMGAEKTIVKRSLQCLIEESGADPNRFLFAEALPHINRLAKVGGALSRRYGFVTWGRKLAALGICQSYERLVQFVEQTKEQVRNTAERS